jgi:alkylation response protein AidB-like acyl-CoA dehydrogenase
MTDGAARLLSRHLAPPRVLPHFQPPPTPDYTPPPISAREVEAESARRVFKRAYNRLISRYPTVRWTSGQWMAERSGGSDVSRPETTATYAPMAEPPAAKPGDELGPWLIDGYKFFSSATDADMTILLARTAGSKKLSAFYAPMRLPNGERNGVRIVRLKNKLGTRALPTAELELKGMRAWLIGNEGEGYREISTILNITRIHNSVSAVSFMRRALSVAKVTP